MHSWGIEPVRRSWFCWTLTLALGATRPLLGQSAATGFASLQAVVTDTLSGRPILRVILWNLRPSPPRGTNGYYVRADTTGQLRLDSIPAGRPQHFQTACDQGGLRSRLLDSTTLTLTAGEVRQWIVRTSGAGCDQRPFVVRRGGFEGSWRSGFEESRFQPCDSLLPEAWVGFAPHAEQAPGVVWPKGLDHYYPEVFVRFEGVLIGPWSYGHLGVADFQLTVNRILAVRQASKAYCGR